MINRIAGTILIVLSVFISTTTGYSQEGEYQVNRSMDKIILEGKVYYIHIVKEKETLYGIGRAYNVTEKVIASENPDVFGGLQAGMFLKIPAEPVVDESVEVKDTEDFFYHVMKEGETLYFLSNKYGIDLVEIERANPEVTISDIQINQVIKVPKHKKPAQKQDFPTDNFVYHYVNQGETLYSLSVKYDVSIGEIKEINPELRWGELKSEQYIKIPRRSSHPLTLETDPEGRTADSLVLMTDSLDALNIAGIDSIHGDVGDFEPDADSLGIPFWSTIRMRRIKPEPLDRTINVAMMLPLYLHWDERVSDTIPMFDEEGQLIEEVEEEDQEEDVVNPRIIYYLEFYQGALLALDSLRRQGFSVNFYTYDTERERYRTMEILRKPELRDMDLIIGPVSFWNLEIVAEFARNNEIPMVLPFSSRKEIVNYNPWVFQTTPTYEIEFKAWAEYLSDYYNKTMILVHSGDSNEYERIRFLKNELFRNISEKADIEDLVFKEVIVNDSVHVDMDNVLNREQENLVIVPSDNEAYVSNVISPLFYQLNDYEIQVSGMPQWSKFRNIDLIYFHNLNIGYFTSFYMDFNDPEMGKFIDRFYSVYRTEPYRISPRGYNLSVYGYDLVYTFVNALGEYGDNLIYFGEEISSDPMLGPYRFSRISDFGGHVNTYMGMVKFSPDLNIQKVDLERHPAQELRYRRYSKRDRIR